MQEGFFFEEYDETTRLETGFREITDDMIRTFVELNGFNTPTYTDPSYMKMSYGGRMSPGMLVLSLAEGLVLDAGVTRKRGIFLMELTPKFKKPVYAGDRIANRMRFKSKKLTSKPDRGVVVCEHEVFTEKGDIAIVYDAVRMIRTRAFVEAAQAA
ncbi:MaoC family dehydratase [Hydrogenophaga sp.]|uniref:MaoC family dehydratase n=1 Tax=Hydrogenophaga sp. TaxID=1904254 RepID=UPI002716D960|nr:MaoC family dehydratase [Hydrogenophaga sp.]MDO9433954.1 MaoC family dehydratase [Hydrogenophaga sp.]